MITDTFHNVSVVFDKGRWNLYITVTKEDGEVVKFIASADSGLTYGDALYFADEEQYKEDLEDLW